LLLLRKNGSEKGQASFSSPEEHPHFSTKRGGRKLLALLWASKELEATQGGLKI